MLEHPMIREIMQHGYPRESPFAWGYEDEEQVDEQDDEE